MHAPPHDTATDTTTGTTTGAPAIVLEHAGKLFGELRALDDVSFQVRSGEIFGLIGPNGSGKTTLIRLLLGLARPTSGVVRVLGGPVPSQRTARQIGYMTQESALYSDLSVTENLRFFGGLYGLRGRALRARIAETLALVDLTDRASSVVRTLSGGMRQRVSLACALIHAPRLLFLDEPTVGIDPELRAEFWEHFARLAATGVTIIVSTHHLDEARRCDRLALLRFGRLLVVDTPEALRRESGEEDFDRAFLYFARQGAPATVAAGPATGGDATSDTAAGAR
ncbi:MAG TPA: heme ABC exporter ATP-binding protein CcmA [Ktedonobacterales bacterium]